MKNKYIKEIKKLLALAVPLVLSLLLASGKGFVDTIMVGNIDKQNLTAMALATSIYVTLVYVFASMSSTVVSVLARKLAKKDSLGFAHYAQQNMYLNIAFGIVIGFIFINADILFSYLNLQGSTKQISGDYLFILGVFYPLACFRFIFRPIILAIRKNKVLFYISLFGFLLNIPLNYVLIFGELGFPRLGAVGSAYATTICLLIEAVAMGLYCLKSKDTYIFHDFEKPNLKTIKSIINLGLPAGMGVLLEYGMFAVVAFMLTNIGEETVAAHQITATNMSFVFILPIILMMVLNQRVSYYIGKKDFKKIKTTVISASIICLVNVCCTVLITILFSTEISGIYTQDSEIIKIAATMFLISAGYHLFDSFYIASIGVLRAFKKNKYIFKCIIVSYWCVGFPVGFILSNYYGGYGYWLGFIACFALLSTLTCVKAYQLVWQNK